MSSQQSWEDRIPSWEDREPIDPDHDSSSDEEWDYSKATAEQAGSMFIEMLLTMLYAGQMSAKCMCLLCYWTGKARAGSYVASFGFRPDAPSGHYSRHVDTVTGVKLKQSSARRCAVIVPQHSKHDHSRTAHTMYMNAPHEKHWIRKLRIALILLKIFVGCLPLARSHQPTTRTML